MGLSETEAAQQGISFEVTRYALDNLDRAITDDVAYGFVKVLTEPHKDRILGVTIVGERAGDLIAEFVLAMKHELGLNKILQTIHIYPTLAEANKFAAGEWKRAHAPEKLLAWCGTISRMAPSMKTLPSLSVIIPVLNESMVVQQTLQCLMPLRGQNVEVIVVDGGSTDQTVAFGSAACGLRASRHSWTRKANECRGEYFTGRHPAVFTRG